MSGGGGMSGKNSIILLDCEASIDIRFHSESFYYICFVGGGGWGMMGGGGGMGGGQYIVTRNFKKKVFNL